MKSFAPSTNQDDNAVTFTVAVNYLLEIFSEAKCPGESRPRREDSFRWDAPAVQCVAWSWRAGGVGAELDDPDHKLLRHRDGM